MLELVIDHVVKMYGDTNRKVLEESCKKMLLILLITGYRPRGIDVWSHQQKSARRQLQDKSAALANLVTNHVLKVYGGANRKVLKESFKKMALLLLTRCYSQ